MPRTISSPSRGKKLAFSAVATLLFFGLAEAGLQLVALATGQDWRVNPLPDHGHLDVLCTHDETRVRLCPDQGPSYEKVRAEVFTLAPTNRRVIAVGESFVHGLGVKHAEAWPARLEAHLQDRLGEEIEVLNMGRCGTYTGRLIPIVEAAVALKPEILILAVGNNEHTMTSFYPGWAARHPSLVYTVSDTFSPLQSYGLLYRTFGGSPKPVESFTKLPEDVSFDDPLDEMIFAARRRPAPVDKIPDALAGPEVTAVLEKEHRLKERIFEGHLVHMIEMAEDAGIQVVLATVPQDLSLPPVLSGVHEGDEAEIRTHLRSIEGDQSQDRHAALNAALDAGPKVSKFLYMKGRELQQAGDHEAAIVMYRQAVEWDLAPDGTPTINDITRRTAEAHGLLMVDLDVLSGAHLDNPREVFKDHVHVNAAGAEIVGRMLADALAPTMAIKATR